MPDRPCRRAARKRPDTVGQPPRAEICVPNMPSWQAKQLRKLPQEKVLLELWNRLANSIRPFVRTRRNCTGIGADVCRNPLRSAGAIIRLGVNIFPTGRVTLMTHTHASDWENGRCGVNCDGGSARYCSLTREWFWFACWVSICLGCGCWGAGMVISKDSTCEGRGLRFCFWH